MVEAVAAALAAVSDTAADAAVEAAIAGNAVKAQTELRSARKALASGHFHLQNCQQRSPVQNRFTP